MYAVSWYPAAVRKPLPENSWQSAITPTQLIFHTAACRCGDSLYDDFNRKGNNLESHFHVQSDGGVEQYIDTNVRADANYKANARAISVETQDDGDATQPWTAAQLDALIALAVWAHREHGIPAVICPAWDKPGLGHHTLFGAPGPWTPVAKSCPGPARKRQFVEVITPKVAAATSAPARRPAVARTVRNHVRSIFAPNGGVWHLQEDGGIITDTDGAGSPEAPYYGSIPEPGDAAVFHAGSKAVDLLPFRGGYLILAQHSNGSVTPYHFPA